MMEYDAVVIGSGFGGAVTAARLAEAGLRVAIVEKGAFRGEEAGRVPFPSSPLGLAGSLHAVDLGGPLSLDRPLRRNGLFELHYLSGVGMLAGVGVGGSSLVYGGVTQRPAPDFFDAFPAEVDREGMHARLTSIEAALGASAWTRPSPRVEVLRRSAADVPRAHVELLAQAIRWHAGDPRDGASPARGVPEGHCTLCNLCTIGCSRGAKQTLDRNFVARAGRHGAVVLDRHEARFVLDHGGGFTVECIDQRGGRFGGAPRSLRARRVVLAAGAVHTHKLLFRSRERADGLPRLSPALGRRFSLGGDTIALYRGCDDGLTYGGHGAEAGIFVHDADGRRDHVVFPSEPPFADAWWMRPFRRVLDRTLILAGMGRDDANGVLTWRRGHLHLDLPPQPLARRILATMDAVARHYGAPERSMKLRPGVEPRPRATVHPMGGCCMADGPEQGVVDFGGEAFGHPGLFVADASVLPRPPAAAPSLAIAAVASHVADQILEERGLKRPRHALAVTA